MHAHTCMPLRVFMMGMAFRNSGSRQLLLDAIYGQTDRQCLASRSYPCSSSPATQCFLMEKEVAMDYKNLLVLDPNIYPNNVYKAGENGISKALLRHRPKIIYIP